jgi:integrase
MTNLDRYLDAATRENTRRSYAGAARHFEVDWGGHLPATADSIAHYLADYAEKLALNTLRHRLAALAQWHHDHGFADPTRAPLVRKVFKGIAALHPRVDKRATPLQITQLTQVSDRLDATIASSFALGANAEHLQALRDRAMVLLGFWRGFRTDELMRLQVEHIQIVAGEGMLCFLPHTKGDRQNQGTTFKVPALSRLCPVTAYGEWIAAAELSAGPVFRAVNQWGQVNDVCLHPNSFIRLLRRVFEQADLPSPNGYSGHSLRRGFAGWASDNGWDVKALMEYVGWKDVHSAMRYIDSGDPFAKHRIEDSLRGAARASHALSKTKPNSQIMATIEAKISSTVRP